jgi:hypothetical protein
MNDNEGRGAAGRPGGADQDDEFGDDVREQLAFLGGEAIPPDAEFLRSLRERAAAEFAAAVASDAEDAEQGLSALRVHPHTGPVPGGEGVEHAATKPRTAWRRAWVAAAAACLAMFGWWVAGNTPAIASGVTLGDVLQRTLAAAKSLRLEFHRGDEQSEIWVADGNRVRWDDKPGQYTIARGSQLWRVDESTNTAARSSAPWAATPDRPIDLIALLEAGGQFELPGVELWLAAEPTGDAEYLGRRCREYAQLFTVDGRLLRLVAYADAATSELVGIVAWPGPDRRDNGAPLAELRLIGRNLPVDESKFVVASSLTEDGRIGKVVDVQGLIALQPPLARRWTPVCGPLLLKPGDWVRTERRGANAVRIVLSSQVELTLGPGGLVELASPTRVRVLSGDVQAKVPPAATAAFTLLGRNDAVQTVAVGAEATFRRRTADAELVRLENKPPWLLGFESSTSDESLGSLIATVDGKNVPLSVGYHKVTVDIRDQIARTVIEESFVNHTNGRLEGVFYFPLPADASISGFGMWIGGELVEADVVEKQRAREIYETILREKRDPGLLEWTSGNLFKARVFPIEANSEKRIKLVYTQVLPLRDNRYVYSYGLRSELLRTRPLRELGIDVRVSSELPLRSVTCPTHDVRSELTPHAAHVQFAAQEYAPTRDFEVVCEIDGRQSDVVVIPHQRGADGYFLVQLTPPAPGGAWRREMLGEGPPLDVLLVCDTSGSMDSESRRQQREFVAAVLGALGPEDRFNLAVCDVDCRWALANDDAEPSAPATPERIDQALAFLDARPSLGWTDLDAAFAAALDRAADATQVIYIGDGVPSAGDADPQALAARLRRLYDALPRGTFHAVAVGNLVDAAVLKTIAGCGGGSQRQIGGEMTPQRTALELLREVTDPGLRDLQVEFSGVQVAAVYPEQLPNLPAGSQQILVGRYLPQATDQRGDLIVTGKRGNETVRYATSVHFPATTSLSGSLPLEGRAGEGGAAGTRAADDADATGAGNSFIPRLWARQHLDHLLAQGASPVIQDEIIALSEEFHIITPYTSLLVLESDADRERFGVKRRFQMRDGERFFAQGRDNADFELVQQQMRLAGDWRQGLRQQALARLATLGRSTESVQHTSQWAERLAAGVMPASLSAPSRRRIDNLGRTLLQSSVDELADVTLFSAEPPLTFSGSSTLDGEWESLDRSSTDQLSAESGNRFWRFDGGNLSLGLEFSTPYSFRQMRELELAGEVGVIRDYSGVDLNGSGKFGDPLAWQAIGSPLADFTEWRGEQNARILSDGIDAAFMPALGKKFEADYGYYYALERSTFNMPRGGLGGGDRYGFDVGFSRGRGGAYAYDAAPPRGAWLAGVLPALPHVAWPTPTQPPRPSADDGWTAEAIALADSLVRKAALDAVTGGLELRRTSETFDPRWDRRTTRSEHLLLWSPTAWLARPLGAGVQTIVQWCDATERGAFSRAFQIGSVRPAKAFESKQAPLSLPDYSLAPLYEVYLGHKATLERRDGGRVVLALAPKRQPASETRFTIDDQRHAVVEIQVFSAGQLSSTTRFDDFIEVAGTWWAQRIETRDAAGDVTGRTTLSIELRDAAEFAARLAEELPSRAGDRGSPRLSPPSPALLIHFPLPSLQKAKEQLASGAATLEAQLVLLDEAVARQQWDEAFERLAAIETRAAHGPDQAWSGRALLRLVLEQAARRHAIVLDKLNGAAAALVAAPPADNYFLANYLLDVASSIADANEQLRLLDALRPTFASQPEYVEGVKRWQERRLDLLANLGRNEERLAEERALAVSVPWDAWRQIYYARDLWNAGQREAAYAWIEQELARNPRRDEREQNQLVFAHADLLHQESRFANEADYLAPRVERGSDEAELYDRYLSALIYADRLPRAEELATEWLAIGRRDDSDSRKLPPRDLARLQSAVAYARANRRNINMDGPELKWLAPLADVVRRLAWNPDHYGIAGEILGDYRVADSDEIDAVRRELFARLPARAASLPPQQLSSFVNWLINARELTADDDWKAIAAAARQRWTAADDWEDKQWLSSALVAIYSNRLAAEYLPFLRAQVDAADDAHRPASRRQLFDALLAQPWSAEFEAESLALVPRLPGGEESAARLPAELPALMQWVDRMVQSRVDRARQELDAAGHPEQLTRAELAAKEAEFLKAARAGVADRLAAAEDTSDAELSKWVRLERVTLDVQLERDLDAAAATCWDALGEAPPRHDASGEAESDAVDDAPAPDADPADPAEVAAARRAAQQAMFDAIYRSRAFAIVSYLAARRGADAALADRLLAYIDAGIANGGELADDWRAAKYRLLLALDRPDDLRDALQAWIAAGSAVSPWRAPLGRLLAERGQLAEAIAVFEQIRATDALSPGDLAALAGWYQAVDRREDYERTVVDAYLQLEEWNLQQMVQGRLNWWNRGAATLPSELDPQTLQAFQALFRKSSSPGYYVWLLRDFYAACRDFRLLAMIPDALLGRTQQTAYPFLESLNSTLLAEVRDEAVADEILRRVGKLRDRELTALDARALDLLEALVERRSAEVLNQPGPHVDAAVAALRRAFRDEWAEGEQVQMARLLAQLGRISAPRLGEIQVQQLRSLFDGAPRGSVERMQIAGWLANALFWSYDRQDEALAVLQGAVDELLAQRDGVWPRAAYDALDGYVGMLERRGRFAEAEALLKRLADKPESPDMARDLADRVNRAYLAALENGGQVSLGRGQDLFRNLAALVTAEFAHPNAQYRYNAFERLMDLVGRAHARPEFAAAADEALRTFARDSLPKLLASQPEQYESYVSTTAVRFHDLLGARAGLAFILGQMEHYPPRLEMSRQNSWNQFNGYVSQWRTQVGDGALGELEAPLLAHTLQALRRDLETRQWINRQTYYDDYSYFWDAKRDAFAELAHLVLDQRRQSGRSVKHIAEYLYHGLGRDNDAVAALLIAHDAGILDDAGQRQLVDYLFATQRFGESVAILQGLVARLPDDASLRHQLMEAYFQTKRLEQLNALQQASDEHFRSGGRWSESVAATLADACRRTQLNDLAIGYYREAIEFAERQGPARGVGNDMLRSYYSGLAETYSAMGKTAEAIDAAAGAVVAWSQQQHQREYALNSMRTVLNNAQDLETYAASLDVKADETGQDSPLIRKMVGQALLGQGKAAAAEAQLRAAVALDPTDLEAHKSLVESLDAQSKSVEAAHALLAAIDVDRRNLDLLKQLADRLAGDEAQAERAATMVVEAAPQEAENHQALAERRQAQDRWSEAAEQWRHVARLRSLEPQGLVGLAGAQLHLEEWDAAAETIARLRATAWPARFGDLPGQISNLENLLNARRNQ